MKKKLESELISIAHRILKLKGKEDVIKMHTEVSQLFEKISVLKFAYENFEDEFPKIGNDSSFFDMLGAAFNNKVSDNIEVEDKIYINLDDRGREEITVSSMSRIKDMLQHMPDDDHEVDDSAIFEKPLPSSTKKADFDEITSDFKDMPVFEAVSKVKTETSNEKKSLNDQLKVGGFKIGLNDKIAFIKHLFDGKSEDYDRVLSQLNTIDDFEQAQIFIQNMVKPDYNNWVSKEEFETRFMEIIETKFS